MKRLSNGWPNDNPPVLTVKDGVVVKGVKFRGHEVVGEIVPLAKRYAEEGADELVFYDITASSDGRVVDKSDDRKVTTSEGQSYAMFFALVTNDQVTFDGLAAWTADNLSGGDLTKTLPAWLWGRGRGDKWGILDTNNATDSDMWIAWCFLEAGRLWKSEEYTKKGMAMLELLKKEVRTVDNLGSVVLPGRVGFEDNGTVKLNPSYYPLFLFKRFALEDAYWNEVYEGSLRMLLRSSPAGIAPDWALFDKGRPSSAAQRRRLRDRQLQRHPHVSVGGHDVARRSQPRDPHEALQPDGRGDEGAQHAAREDPHGQSYRQRHGSLRLRRLPHPDARKRPHRGPRAQRGRLRKAFGRELLLEHARALRPRLG